MDRCHAYRGTHIPGCDGCAFFGHDHCTCPPGATRQELEARVAKLEAQVKALSTAQKPGGTP